MLGDDFSTSNLVCIRFRKISYKVLQKTPCPPTLRQQVSIFNDIIFLLCYFSRYKFIPIQLRKDG